MPHKHTPITKIKSHLIKKIKTLPTIFHSFEKEDRILLDHNFCTLRPKHFMKRQIQNFTEVTVMRVANKNVIKLMKVYFYPRTIASPREDSPTMRTIRNE